MLLSAEPDAGIEFELAKWFEIVLFLLVDSQKICCAQDSLMFTKKRSRAAFYKQESKEICNHQWWFRKGCHISPVARE
jgi:hypothetical protein